MNDKSFIALKQKNGPDFKMASFCPNLFNKLTQISDKDFKFDPGKVGGQNQVSTDVYNRFEEFDLKDVVILEIFGVNVNAVMFTPETGTFKEIVEGKSKTFEFDVLKMGIGRKVEADFKTTNTLILKI